MTSVVEAFSATENTERSWPVILSGEKGLGIGQSRNTGILRLLGGLRDDTRETIFLAAIPLLYFLSVTTATPNSPSLNSGPVS